MPSPKVKTKKSRKKVSKKQLVSYLLEHAVDLHFSAEELYRLPTNILLGEKIHVQINDDEDSFRTPQELTAIEFILSQPDNIFSRSDLETMCTNDLLDEERVIQNKMRKQIVRQSIFLHS